MTTSRNHHFQSLRPHLRRWLRTTSLTKKSTRTLLGGGDDKSEPDADALLDNHSEDSDDNPSKKPRFSVDTLESDPASMEK